MAGNDGRDASKLSIPILGLAVVVPGSAWQVEGDDGKCFEPYWTSLSSVT